MFPIFVLSALANPRHVSLSELGLYFSPGSPKSLISLATSRHLSLSEASAVRQG
ncbi:hypothetical protein A2U01_0085419 [Trifolium medium]|uniref:Uncharacterized protein n=1 Tax=Trifolium medium TaxID=97028 RepID=A0A392TSI9_9FABA|nr:hypothetical protein [Trifolium medium]